jgi:hypothetical protein
MKNLPFDRPGRFWRGNLHTHSTVSDGALTPEQTCEFYRNAGYDFLAITDHFTERSGFIVADTRPYRTPDFTTLIGAELHTPATAFSTLWHILAVGLPLDFAPTPPDQTGPELAARALAAGAYVAAAHPAWYGLTEEEVLALGPVHAIETYNSTAIDHNDRPDSWYMLDLLLNRGHRYFGCAVDDAHFQPSRDDALRGWVQVRSETLEPAALLAALKAGHYYSSTGPEIYDIRVIPGDRVIVRCSPASRIFVTGYAWNTVFAYGSGITEAELSLEKFNGPFCRVTVRDEQDRRAWSNPIWFE